MDKGQFLLYQTPDGESKIEVKLQDDTVWLSLCLLYTSDAADEERLV